MQGGSVMSCRGVLFGTVTRIAYTHASCELSEGKMNNKYQEVSTKHTQETTAVVVHG